MKILSSVRTMAGILVSCLLLLSSANLLAQSGTYISVEELTSTIKSRNVDQVIRSLNTVKQMSYQGDILPFIRDLWDMRKEKYPDLPWQVINADVVRVDLANILLQAEANGKIDIDKDEMHSYVVGLVNSSNVDVAMSSILTLSLFDNGRDVDRILAVAKQQKKGTFRAAVIALSKMCAPEAEHGLENLENWIVDSELKAYVIETRRESLAFKQRSGWCSQNP